MDNKTYTDQPELPLKISNEISLKTTPMFQQYLLIKSEYEDCLLFFRMGDFYETFEEDAIVASEVLGITLTKRANGAAASTNFKTIEDGYTIIKLNSINDI